MHIIWSYTHMFIYISFACVNICLKILYVVSRKSVETLHEKDTHQPQSRGGLWEGGRGGGKGGVMQYGGWVGGAGRIKGRRKQRVGVQSAEMQTAFWTFLGRFNRIPGQGSSFPIWSVPTLHLFCCQFWGKNICLNENIYSSVYSDLIYSSTSWHFLFFLFLSFHLCFSQRMFQDSSILVGSFLMKETSLEWNY